jgi:hypothetical protein
MSFLDHVGIGPARSSLGQRHEEAL